jgi:type 1 glutamine amidotransferase
MKPKIIASTLIATALLGARVFAFPEVTINGVSGFQDTPMEPDGKWHVHDPARPQPIVITPGGSFSQNATPPSDAIILFDGTDFSQWRDKKTGGPVGWKIHRSAWDRFWGRKTAGIAVSAQGDIETTNKFGDLQLHLEFREPTPAKGESQGRGNSGVFLMGLYEVQVLDCYQNLTYADGTIGAIYGQHPPLANACRPPGEWQTYDIIFSAPHFDADNKLVTPAYVTVILNGVVVQNHQAIRGETNWRSVGSYTHFDSTGPIALQYHNNAVAFRNIWVRPIPAVNERLLVVTTTTGYRHGSISTAEKILSQLASKSGEFTLDFVEQPAGKPANPAPDASEKAKAAYKTAEAKWEDSLKVVLQKLSPASLKYYDGVIFASTTGDLPIPDKQGFLDWIKAGHAFIGIHAASDTFHGWPGYIDMLGGEFMHHGKQVSVDCLNQDPSNPATASLPKVWTLQQEEIYQFKNYDPTKVHDLLILDKHPETGASGHYAVSWCKEYGAGRVFYTSLGHREDLWDADPNVPNRINSVEMAKQYQAHVLGGIEWALDIKK